MTPAAELWKRILAAPADADLKAQYVAALVADGNWRGEMFTLSAEYDKLRVPAYTDPAAANKAAEIKPRLDALFAQMRDDFAPLAAVWGGMIHFIGGWPIELTIAADAFTRQAAEIVATIPLRHLDLTAIRAFPAVFDVSQLEQIASLDGSRQTWSDDTLHALVASPHIDALRWLNLSQCSITKEQVELLAASEALRTVEILDLSDNPTPDPCDASAGYGTDWMSGGIVPESVGLPEFGAQLEARFGKIRWLNPLWNYFNDYPPSRYSF
jgi:hypothetical protein